MNKFIAKYPFAVMIFANAVMGLNSTLAKLSIDEIPSLLFIGLRYLFSGLVFLSIALYAKEHLKSKDYRHMAIQSVLQIIVAVSWYVALGMTQAINAAIMFLLTPIMVYIGSILFLGEPRSNRAMAGSLIAFSGGILLFGAPAIGNGNDQELIGNGLLLIAASFLAILILHSKKIITEDNFNMVLGVRFGMSAMAGILLSLIFQDPSRIATASTTALSALALSATFCGALGLVLYYKALNYMRAEDSATVFYVDPLFGALAGSIILGETLSDTAFIATSVILAGVLISHPAHVNRMWYYSKVKVSRFEEFVRWARREYDSAYNLVKKYF